MKRPIQSLENFILLPVSKTRINTEDSAKVADFLTQLLKTKDLKLKQDVEVKVLDSIDTDGAKLIQINPVQLPDFKFNYPGLRIIPEKFYHKAVCQRKRISAKVKSTQAVLPITITINDPQQKPIQNITVVVFTDFAMSRGASGITDKNGSVKLILDKDNAERIYIYADHSYWGSFQENVKLTSNLKFTLQPVKTDYTDSLRYFYDTGNWPRLKQKIRVGIIDTGVGPHKDLHVSGGKNLVKGEDENNYEDNGEGHGTHVAGIIAASGGINGVAAGVQIMSYRVFPKDKGASNFDIMKAIAQAISDKCDLINMSLGEAEDDEGLTSYIKDAYNEGILCFAANGNDSRSAVSFPAAYSLCVAISAMGRIGTFPEEAVEESAVQEPFGTDNSNFIADFSNIGLETDLTAPGVGIISTYPNDYYAIMDGTSMACPAATGMAARLLSHMPEFYEMQRNQDRSVEMLKFLARNITPLGFGANFEGKGMLCYNNELHSKI